MWWLVVFFVLATRGMPGYEQPPTPAEIDASPILAIIERDRRLILEAAAKDDTKEIARLAARYRAKDAFRAFHNNERASRVIAEIERRQMADASRRPPWFRDRPRHGPGVIVESGSRA